MKSIILEDDMGTLNKLKFTFEDDGDVIVTMISENNIAEVQICQSGTQYPNLANKLRKIFEK